MKTIGTALLTLLIWALAVPLVVTAQPLELSGIVATQTSGWRVLRNQTDLNQFIQRIPKWRMQKEQPAPLNPDPILNNPEIDFDDHVLVVIWSDNVHIIPKIDQTRREGRDLYIQASFSAPRDYRNYQAPLSHGRYHLIEMLRFDGELKVTTNQVEIPLQPLP